MNYQEFVEIAEPANERFGGTLETEGMKLNEGMTYREKANEGRAEVRNRKDTLKLVWQYVRKCGWFEYNGQSYNV